MNSIASYSPYLQIQRHWIPASFRVVHIRDILKWNQVCFNMYMMCGWYTNTCRMRKHACIIFEIWLVVVWFTIFSIIYPTYTTYTMRFNLNVLFAILNVMFMMMIIFYRCSCYGRHHRTRWTEFILIPVALRTLCFSMLVPLLLRDWVLVRCPFLRIQFGLVNKF